MCSESTPRGPGVMGGAATAGEKLERPLGVECPRISLWAVGATLRAKPLWQSMVLNFRPWIQQG